MALIPHQDYRIVVAFNNAPNLVNIEIAIPLYRDKPLIVQGIPLDGGIHRIGADKSIYRTGFSMIEWLAPCMGRNQYYFIQDTYTRGGNSFDGPVTIRTRFDDTTFANYSATLQLPKPSTLQRKYDSYLGVMLRFVIEAIL